MNGRILGSSESQIDVEVLIHRFLKAARKVNRVDENADGTLAFISRGREYKC